MASPTNGTLYLVFADNRAGVARLGNPRHEHERLRDEQARSPGLGAALCSWTRAAGDQWFPWVEVDPTNGTIGILYHDRGSVQRRALLRLHWRRARLRRFAKTTVSTAPSNPTDSIYFRAQVPGCMDCATFHGDYINVSYGSDGVANVAWTDMREFRPAENGFAQYIYFARK